MRFSQGVTLVELLVAVAVSMILLGAMYTVYLFHQKTQIVQEDVVEMQQNARAAMDLLVREVRMAGFDPRGVNTDSDSSNDFEGLSVDGGVLHIRSDMNGNGTPSDSSEWIRYSFDATTLMVRRRTGHGGRQPVVEHVEAFAFQAFDEHGLPTLMAKMIREVELMIRVRTAHVDASYPDNHGYRTLTLRSRVSPRNLGWRR